MSFDGFMCLNGIEIINSSRLAQMIAYGRGPEGLQCRDCAPCPDLDKGLGYPGGYNVGDSPWYDPDQPESIDFAGLLVTDISGLGPGEFARPVIETAGIGAILGQGRNQAPQIVVTALLMARTCCAMEYGLRWLSSALRQPCAPGAPCAGADLLYLACEPSFPDEDCPENEDQDYEALLAPFYRTIKNAALISGPTPTQIIPRGCPGCYECGIQEVTFTLSAGDPCVYRDPVLLVEDEVFDCVEPADDCIEWITNPAEGCDDEELCASSTNCATDPNCFDVDPPAMPAILNPCNVECIGVPTCRVCVDIPAGTFPATGEGTLRIEIFAGSSALRRIQIRVWENPLGLPVDELDICDVCTELNVSYIGPDATLTIDGAGRSAIISCPGGEDVRANTFISSATGTGAFSYPSLSGCGGPYTACIVAQGPVSDTATVTVEAIGREC